MPKTQIWWFPQKIRLKKSIVNFLVPKNLVETGSDFGFPAIFLRLYPFFVGTVKDEKSLFEKDALDSVETSEH